MDPHLFSAASPGKLVPIDGDEVAFVPDALPPSWQFPVTLWPLLADVKQLVGKLDGIGSVLPNPGILLRPLADREAIQSSRLEGTYATARELLLFELQPKAATSGADPLNDHREVYNYQRALYHGVNGQLPISLRLIRDLHNILMTGVRGKDKTPGEFRKVQVAMGSTRRFVPPPSESLDSCLHPLEAHIHARPADMDPFVHCFMVHYQFETIHPFVDGNGRVGRLLLALMLKECCGLAKPWLYMSEYFERHRDEYISRLFAVSTRGEWSEWVEFCLRATLAHAQATIILCTKLLAVRDQYAERIKSVKGSVRLSRIINNVFDSPIIRLTHLAEVLGVTYPTAKADVERLVKANILEEIPGVTPKTFYAPEVFSVAYGGI